MPYAYLHPWWPSAESDADAYRQVGDVFSRLLSDTHGRYTTPVTHRDGHRLWVTLTFNQVEEPDTGRRVMVGTFRDVTAEHYAMQRQSALAALNEQLAQADTLDDAVRAAAEELRKVWLARRVLALSNIEVFAHAVTDAVTTGPQDGELLTIDLSEVEYLDSGAINALFEHAAQVHLIANPVLMPVLKISGLTEAATVEAAPPTA